MATLLGLDEEACTVTADAGGKGASLARLAGLDLPVPAGFVVCCGALEASLGERADELRRAVAGAHDEDKLAACASAAQAIVAGAELATDLKQGIRARYQGLGDDVPVAVRSSAAAEDGDAASFAGQQETYLNVRGAEAVVEKIRACWGSYFTERALFYRARKGSLEDLGMAVVVQRLVAADVAGVMFTIDPVRDRKDRIVVEAVLGLGEGVVSGEITPDNYQLKRNGQIAREKISVQPSLIEGIPGGGVRERALSPEEGARRKVDAQTLSELARIGVLLQEELGGPQDVEWALESGQLQILQSRPVTT